MNVIFVCTGNTCRSPMAEGYLKSKNIDGLSVISRGFGTGEAANKNSVAAMQEAGIDISNHISRQITAKDVENADAIICMTDSHKNLLVSMGVPKDKITVLSGGIPDPFGGDLNVYRKCRDMIFDGINALIKSGFFGGTVITVANSSDIADISNIEKSVFSTPWSEKAISESMNSGTKFFVAKQNGQTVGYMGISEIAKEGYVTNVAVLERFRNRGIGTKLLQYVINSEKSNLEFISLEVRVSNTNAVSLYQKLGFEKVGLRRRFYSNPTEDAIIMTIKF